LIAQAVCSLLDECVEVLGLLEIKMVLAVVGIKGDGMNNLYAVSSGLYDRLGLGSDASGRPLPRRLAPASALGEGDVEATMQRARRAGMFVRQG